LEINVGNKLQTKTLTSNGDHSPGTGYIGFSSMKVSVPSGISIDTDKDVWTSDRPSGTELTKLRNAYETARSNADNVMFTVKCKCGASKTYYMEP
jgi:hypothetical protein